MLFQQGGECTAPTERSEGGAARVGRGVDERSEEARLRSAGLRAFLLRAQAEHRKEPADRPTA